MHNAHADMQIQGESNRERRSRPMRRAFTLIELMIAIGVIIALVAVTLPAFRAIQSGNRESGGINAVTAALNTARSLAVRKGRDVAAVFRFDVARQVTSIQLVEFLSTTADAGNSMGEAAIFIPVKGQSVIELPRGAGVFGYGYAATQTGGDPDDAQNWYCDLGRFYETLGEDNMDPWLFPRSDVRLFAGTLENVSSRDPEFLESFIIRFGPNGTVVSSTEEMASGYSGAAEGYLELNHIYTEDDVSWKDKYREWTPQKINIGNGEIRIIDEMQIRAVPYVAVVDLGQLSSETGIPTPWLTLGQAHPYEGEVVGWDADGDGDEDHFEIDQWINENATILSFNRYTGNIMREFRR